MEDPGFTHKHCLADCVLASEKDTFILLLILRRGLGAHSVPWVGAVDFCGNFWAGQQLCDCRHLGIELTHLGVSSCPASVAGWGA